MPEQDLMRLIEAADRAISAEDFDALMTFYADDATLVVTPGRLARGKAEIRRAFEAIAAHFKHRLTVRQGQMQVVEGGDTALVIMETLLEAGEDAPPELRRATYVFRQSAKGQWLCVVDNSYGTALLDG